MSITEDVEKSDKMSDKMSDIYRYIDEHIQSFDEKMQSSGIPAEILKRCNFESCIIQDDKKELYIVRCKKDDVQAIVRLSKNGSHENAAAEGAILDKLDHPCIPRLFYAMTQNDCGYIIREYFEGQTLCQLVQSRGIRRSREILSIVRCVMRYFIIFAWSIPACYPSGI